MRQYVIGFLVLTALTAGASQAAPLKIGVQVDNCNRVVQECKDVIAAADKFIEEQKREIQIQHDLLDIKDERIKELDVWWRDPKYSIPIGIFLGIFIQQKAR